MAILSWSLPHGHVSSEITPLSTMCGISAAIHGARPKHIACPMPKRGLHHSTRYQFSCRAAPGCHDSETVLWSQAPSCLSLNAKLCPQEREFDNSNSFRNRGIVPLSLHVQWYQIVKKLACSWPIMA